MGSFTSFFQFCESIDTRLLNKRVLESLIRAGAMDGLGAHRAQMIAAIDRAMERAQKLQRDARKLASTDFSAAEGRQRTRRPPEFCPTSQNGRSTNFWPPNIRRSAFIFPGIRSTNTRGDCRI